MTISLDADLQDDLGAIPRMLHEHRAGAEIVYGVRARRDTDTWFKRTTARGYYALLRMFGSGLLALTKDPELVPDSLTYGERQLRSVTAPGALVEGFRFTL